MGERKKLALLLAGMKQIEKLPEYVNEKSRHALWLPVEEDAKQLNFLLPGRMNA